MISSPLNRNHGGVQVNLKVKVFILGAEKKETDFGRYE